MPDRISCRIGPMIATRPSWMASVSAASMSRSSSLNAALRMRRNKSDHAQVSTNTFIERCSDGGLFGLVIANAPGLVNQPVINRQIGCHPHPLQCVDYHTL